MTKPDLRAESGQSSGEAVEEGVLSHDSGHSTRQTAGQQCTIGTWRHKGHDASYKGTVSIIIINVLSDMYACNEIVVKYDHFS